MKCCKKFVAVALAVSLGVGTVATVRYLKHRGLDREFGDAFTEAFDSNVPAETQLKGVKRLIDDLTVEINKGWTPIAKQEIAIRDLKKDIQEKTSTSEMLKAELAAASKILDDKFTKVSYNGRDYDSSAKLKDAVRHDLASFNGVKREIESKNKLLAAWTKQLEAMKNNQDAMAQKKSDLETQVAQIEAELAVIKLADTRSNRPTGDQSKLDNIKKQLAKLQRANDITMRAMELRDQHERGENVGGKTAKESNEDLSKQIKAAIGEVGEDAGK